MQTRSKAEISSTYLSEQKQDHGHKPWCFLNIRAAVTGALKPGSIGEAIVKNLAAWECTHYVWAMDTDVREEVQPSLTSYNALILCHGVTWLDWFQNIPDKKLREIIDVNLMGTANMIRAYVRNTLHSNERKRIIVIGSMAHRSVLNGSAVYCASKAGVEMLVRCLAWELAPKGYDVFCIHPSNTEGTPMSEETIRGLMRYRDLDKKTAVGYWNDSPIRTQILQCEDVAGLCRFLLTPGAEYLAGRGLELAGGQR